VYHPSLCLMRNQRPGAVVLWLVLAMTVIVGTVAIGLDGGRLFDERRHAQAAADSAALAAASRLYAEYWAGQGLDPTGDAASAARASAATNGYNNDGVHSTVTVNIPPQSGTFAGLPGYVEVMIQSSVSGSFAKIFTQEDISVKARAVALGRPLRIGILLLQPTGSDALLNSAPALGVINDPVVVNSNDSSAYDQASFGIVTAQRFDLTGNYINPGGALILGPIRTSVQPTPDPLAALPVPDVGGATVQSSSPLTITGIASTLQPGVYQGGISIQGGPLGLPAVVVMNPGVYIMEGGGFSVGPNASVVGPGVMIYNTTGSYSPGPIAINGSSLTTVALTPPMSGTYQGILLFQDRSLNTPLTVSGLTAASVFSGLVYAASARVNLNNSVNVGVFLMGGAYVANSMTIQGVGDINIDLGLNPPRIPDVHLVE
jgi:hypothetical protein